MVDILQFSKVGVASSKGGNIVLCFHGLWLEYCCPMLMSPVTLVVEVGCGGLHKAACSCFQDSVHDFVEV